MGQQYNEINHKNRTFIEQQKIFFVGTATADSRVNISPKGMDSLRILGPNRVIWLNVTGSGNETAAHVQVQSRMTIMFAAFEGKPNILRLYGHAEVIHHNDPQWQALYSLLPPLEGARQIFDMRVDLVQNSCGFAVPFLSYDEDRNQLREWAQKQGDEGLHNYWQKKNQVSIDGIDTHIVAKNLKSS